MIALAQNIMDIHAYVPDIKLGEIAPLLILVVGAIACLIADAATKKNGSRALLPWISGIALVAGIISVLCGAFPLGVFLEDTFITSEFAQIAVLICLFGALAHVILAPRLLEKRNMPSGEYYTLIVFSALGMSILSIANELLTAFVALEIMSLSLYVLAGMDRRSARASEASYKYFILGSFASAFLVLGIAFLFGATNSTHLSEIAAVLDPAVASTFTVDPVWVFLGFSLIFVGVCFKLSLAPFHMWAPDVYQGANTPTAMAIATGSKVATFAFLVNLVDALSVWPLFMTSAAFIIGLVAVTSMLWGNLAAIVQTDIKRMLAYSSVAHSGYLAVGILILTVLPQSVGPDDLELARSAVHHAISLYLAGYTLMNVLAFSVAFHIGGEGNMAAYRGLFYRHPVAAIAMGVAMISLVGIGFTPPTIGFMGKFYLFKEAVNYHLVGIAVIAVIASVISAFYYLGLVTTMFMKEAKTGGDVVLIGADGHNRIAQRGGAATISMAMILTATVLIFILGIAPSMWITFGELMAR